MTFDLKYVSRIKLFKGVNLLIGVISLGLGLFSYFQSAWIKYTGIYIGGTYYGFIIPYKLCQMDVLDPMNFLKSCPDIAWERFFVSVIIICFVLSLMTFLFEFIERVNLKQKPYQITDTIYHIFAAIALVIAGILYILSALLIYDILDLENGSGWEFTPDTPEHKYRTVEKIISAIFVFFQAVSYAATAYRLRKRTI